MKNFAEAELTSHLLHRSDISEISEGDDDLSLFNMLYVLGFLLSLASLFLLAALTQLDRPWNFESSILLYLHSYAEPFLDELMLAISASVTVLALVGAIWLVYRRAWRATVFWLAATLGVEVIAQIAKHVFHYTRPHLWNVISHQSSYSFPSGHATLSMSIALAFFVISFSKTKASYQMLMSVAFVLAVGLSRLYLGVHFPTDILAGWFLATAWICLLALLYKRTDRVTDLGRAV